MIVTSLSIYLPCIKGVTRHPQIITVKLIFNQINSSNNETCHESSKYNDNHEWTPSCVNDDKQADNSAQRDGDELTVIDNQCF